MRRALTLARSVPTQQTAPNPRVGCILVKNGKPIASAAHQRFGGPHAEAIALKKAGKRARGATAYLTLEPCSHTDKKTPPCAQALVRAGIARAVIACRDANPRVDGHGIRLLKTAGIAVTEGVLETEARELNRYFFHWIRTRRPFVTLKMASSLDGKITASRRWLSNPQALQFVQQLRAEHDAILVGRNTVLSDDPRLTLRPAGQRAVRQPLRIVLDSRLAISAKAGHLRVFRNGPLLIACTPQAPAGARQRLEAAGAQVWTSRKAGLNGQVPLDELLAELGRRGVRSVLVEGGGRTATAFIEQRRVDEAWFILTPLLAGTGATPLYLGREILFQNADVRVMGDNAVLHVRPRPQPFSR